MDFISQPNIYGFLFFRFDLPFLRILYFLRVWIIPSLLAPNSQEMLIHLSISQIDIKVISVLFSLKLITISTLKIIYIYFREIENKKTMEIYFPTWK